MTSTRNAAARFNAKVGLIVDAATRQNITALAAAERLGLAAGTLNRQAIDAAHNRILDNAGLPPRP